MSSEGAVAIACTPDPQLGGSLKTGSLGLLASARGAASMTEEMQLGVPEQAWEPITTTALPRGGVYVATRIGAIQVGIPPETIKDSLALGLEVPQYYVLPPERFYRELGNSLGINVAEFEFPAYYNFFLKNQTVKLVVDSEEAEMRIRAVLQETLFGPEVIDPDLDFASSVPRSERPDLVKEMSFFRMYMGKELTLDSLVSFIHLDSSGYVCISGGRDRGQHFRVEIRVTRERGGAYLIDELSSHPAPTCRRRAEVSQFVQLPERLSFHPLPTNSKDFQPPVFGVTVLGNSHGFDPTGSTSGYVLWINRRGYMIDPPPYASVILQGFNIRPSLIDGVIVTHCHADHDAGTFQKILFEAQITIITTRTIYESFIRKYSALSCLPEGMLRQSHRFCPVTIGETLGVRGASFNFFYTLHSIPCIGFEVMFGDKGIAFSADHMNDPERIRKMHSDGILSEGRARELLNFPWHHDVIFHEAGIPPIHTPMRTLQDLPEEVKKKLYVVHVSKSSIPEGSGLRVAPLGVEHTVSVDVATPYYSDAVAFLDLVASVAIFNKISITQARDLMEVGARRKFKAGHVIRRGADEVTDFFVVSKGRALARYSHLAGNAAGGAPVAAADVALTRGDWFGEEVLLSMPTGRQGAAEVVAVTDVEVFVFSGNDLKWIIGGLDAERGDVVHRMEQLLMLNSVLRSMSRGQKLLLESVGEIRRYKAGHVIWERGQPMMFIVLVAEGQLSFRLEDGESRELMNGSFHRDGGMLRDGETRRRQICPETFNEGALLGCAGSLLDPEGVCYPHTLVAATNCTVFAVSREQMHTFSINNPGVFLSIHDLEFVA